MLTNTLMIKFKKGDTESVAKAKGLLLGMRGKIEPLLDIEVKENSLPGDLACDLLVITKFASREDFKAYAVHPLHVEVATFVTGAMESISSVGYES